MKVSFTVYGEPLAQKRHKSVTRDRSGKQLPFVRSYDPSAKDKINFAKVAQLKAPPKLLVGPLRFLVECYFAYRTSDYRSGTHSDQLKPNAPKYKDTGKDWDNCGKLYSDTLTGIFWRNDSQIADGHVIKRYSEKPRVQITIEELESSESDKPLLDPLKQLGDK